MTWGQAHVIRIYEYANIMERLQCFYNNSKKGDISCQ